jgi:hypothetical protein
LLHAHRFALTVLAAAHIVALSAFVAVAQPRNNQPPPRAAPALPPSGHQSEAIDLNEGNSPAQMFASTCSVCHQGGGGLAKGRSAGDLARFLRQHYTTGQQQATALAGFLASGGLGPERPTRPARAEPVDRPPAAIGSRRPSWDDDDDPALDGLPADRRRKPPSGEASRPPDKPPAERRRPAEAKQVAPAARQQAGTKPAPPTPETAAPVLPAPEPAAAPPAPAEKPAVPEIPL